MSAAAHFLTLLFAVPAGILSYLILSMPEHPRLGMEHLLAVVLLFGIPLVGMPEAAGAFVLYFGIGLGLTGYIRRWTHQQPSPDPPTPQPKRESSRTTRKRAPVIFKRQRK